MPPSTKDPPAGMNPMAVNVWSLHSVSITLPSSPAGDTCSTRLFQQTLLFEARVKPCIFIPLMICSIAQYTQWLSIAVNYFLLQFYILSRFFFFFFNSLHTLTYWSICTTVNRLIVTIITYHNSINAIMIWETVKNFCKVVIFFP